MPVSHPDILLIGGGVVGLTTALQLADRGISVSLVDCNQTGREASWAGAGMLPPGQKLPATHDSDDESRERVLRCLSNVIWPDLTARLLQQTGIDNGYRQCGAIELAATQDQLQDRHRAWEAEGIQADYIHDTSFIERHVPGLSAGWSQAVWLPEFCQVRNPRHLKALRTACQMSGVELLENVSDLRLEASGTKVVASSTMRDFQAERICLTAGAWTALLLEPLGIRMPIRPVRGQMLQLRLARLPFRCVVELGSRYLVPRPDGLILVGSTEEHVGFEKQTTNDGIHGLLEFAASLVPELAHAEVVRHWAGLRPASPRGLPFLGHIAEFENLYVGAGHFRSGLQMSPATARHLADILTDSSPAETRDLFAAC